VKELKEFEGQKSRKIRKKKPKKIPSCECLDNKYNKNKKLSFFYKK